MPDVEHDAVAFIEENEPFIEDGGPSTLERIVIDGSVILIALGKELQEATEALTKNQWALVDAIDKKAPAKKLHALEVEERRLKRVVAAKKEGHERFDAFWNRTNEAYRDRMAQSTEAYVYEDTPPPAKRRGFFSRIFG